jgi:hypothetical protein
MNCKNGCLAAVAAVRAQSAKSLNAMALLKNLPNFRIKVSNANWGGQFTHYN